MPLRITQDCVNCNACENVCPNDGIRRGKTAFVIDQAQCTECVGFYSVEQCVAVCPSECIVPNPKVNMTEQELFERARAIHVRSGREPRLSDETSHFRTVKAESWWSRLLGGQTPNRRRASQ